MPPAIPIATYRLQLTGDFDFDAAAGIVPYLKALGISHLYASPFLHARAGSTHGYDIIDHTTFNPELGGEAGFERLSTALAAHDMGLILDFVPNHVGVEFADNPWWLDMLEYGRASSHAATFDVEWDMLSHRSRDGILAPILGKVYGKALEGGEIELRFDPDAGSFAAWYYEHKLPISPERYSEILRLIVREADGDNSPAGRALLKLADDFSNKPRTPATGDAIKTQLAALTGSHAIIHRGLAAYRAGDGRLSQARALHLLLERQHYKLAHWRLASSEINYRRFFDINTLAGIRVEDPTVFNAIHPLVARLIAEGKLHGLRLDHIDGLRDPAQYLRRLQRLIRATGIPARRPFYVIIEKILGEDEELPRFPGIAGTTGYEWLNSITHVLMNPEGLGALEDIRRQLSEGPTRFNTILRDAKRLVLQTLLLSEFTMLTRMLARIAAGNYATRDLSLEALRGAFALYVINFPVYRTYITSAGPTATDRALINLTIAAAKSQWYDADNGLFDFLRDALTLDLLKPGQPVHSKPRVRQFAFKVQQFTGPAMAKSLEDTAFYRFPRLLALNEVGGNPAAIGLTTEQFHAAMQTRETQWPAGMTATATHDTKRGEDARTRILALAEMPDEWAALVARWKLMNAGYIGSQGGRRAPSSMLEYTLYEALVGAWPIGPDDDGIVNRVKDYALKAAREAKQETSWLNPNATYEIELATFIDRTLSDADFRASLDSFVARVSLLGALTSLSQLTLKAMGPGVPDFYQGTEYWETSMVDPDNRRPVNFTRRSDDLGRLDHPDWQQLTKAWRDGGLKLAWTRHLLKLRNASPDLFTRGTYVPLGVTGRDRDHVIAFARTYRNEAVVVAVCKALAPFTDGGLHWPAPDAIEATIACSGIRIAGASQFNTIDLFRDLPVAALRARRVTQENKP